MMELLTDTLCPIHGKPWTLTHIVTHLQLAVYDKEHATLVAMLVRKLEELGIPI